MDIVLRNLTCGYGQQVVFKNFTATMNTGQVFCFLGQNGIGKTTLFKTILGLIPAISGSIFINNQDMKKMSRSRCARMLAYVPQAHHVTFGFSVLDVVLMGRLVQMGPFSGPKSNDVVIAEQALEQLGIIGLRNRLYTQLSGGERQMVLIARALAQEPKFLMLDEPTSSLDFGNQVRVITSIARLAKQHYGIIMTTHFPDHVFLCQATTALLQKNSVYHIRQSPQDISEEDLLNTYGVEVALLKIPYQEQMLTLCRPVISTQSLPTP